MAQPRHAFADIDKLRVAKGYTVQDFVKALSLNSSTYYSWAEVGTVLDKHMRRAKELPPSTKQPPEEILPYHPSTLQKKSPVNDLILSVEVDLDDLLSEKEHNEKCGKTARQANYQPPREEHE